MGMGSEVKAGFDECNHDMRTLGAPFIGTSEKEGHARRRWVLDEQRCSVVGMIGTWKSTYSE